MKNLIVFFTIFLTTLTSSMAASVIATVNGNPITDADITARTELMARQGKNSTTNRKQALQNIIDDYIKIDYANKFNVKPTDKDADKELKRMNMTNISATMRSMARLAIRSDIAWGVIVARTIMPTVEISDNDINTEKTELARERGLPIEIEMIRLIDIPESIAKKLTKPKNCDDAIKIAEDLGGAPQHITAMQYELSTDMRERTANLPILTWSNIKDNSVILICKKTKTKEYKNLDEIIKQNATYKKASFVAEQQLKQLRRKAVIIINDDRYKS